LNPFVICNLSLENSTKQPNYYTMANKEKWLSSKDAQKTAKIKGCDLMHYRTQGKLEFEKRGNAFFYSKESVDKLKK